MRALVQRVSEASVAVEGETLGAIGPGLLVFIGIERNDDTDRAQRLMDRLLNYRVFADEQGRMNRSVRQVGGGVLLVSQFTLAADTRRGLRPSFSSAAPPEAAQWLYDWSLAYLCEHHAQVAAGRFAADMQVGLVNDGPVTFLLDS